MAINRSTHAIDDRKCKQLAKHNKTTIRVFQDLDLDMEILKTDQTSLKHSSARICSLFANCPLISLPNCVARRSSSMVERRNLRNPITSKLKKMRGEKC